MHRSSRLTRLLALALALSLPLPSVSVAAGAARGIPPGVKPGSAVRLPGLAQSVIKNGSAPGFKAAATPLPAAPKEPKAAELVKAMTADSKPAVNEAVQKAAFEGAKPKAREAAVDASQASGSAPSGLNAASPGKSAPEASVPAASAAAASAAKAGKGGFGFRRMVQAAALALVAAIIPSCGGGSGGGFYDPTYVRYASNGHPLATVPYDTISDIEEADLANLINNHRLSLGLPALTVSYLMGDAARADALHQSIHGYTGVYNPEGDGPSQRADAVGIPYWYYTSTTYAGYALVTAYDAFNEILYWDWVVLEDPYLTHMGVGHRFDAASPWQNHYTVDWKQE